MMSSLDIRNPDRKRIIGLWQDLIKGGFHSTAEGLIGDLVEQATSEQQGGYPYSEKIPAYRTILRDVLEDDEAGSRLAWFIEQGLERGVDWDALRYEYVMDCSERWGWNSEIGLKREVNLFRKWERGRKKREAADL